MKYLLASLATYCLLLHDFTTERTFPKSPAIMEIDAGFQRELEIPLFEIKDIPGKGKGLVARSDIPIGTRILCEEPLLIIQPKPNEELELLLAAKLKAMPNVSQRQFLSLHNNFPGRYPLSGIMWIRFPYWWHLPHGMPNQPQLHSKCPQQLEQDQGTRNHPRDPTDQKRRGDHNLI